MLLTCMMLCVCTTFCCAHTYAMSYVAARKHMQCHMPQGTLFTCDKLVANRGEVTSNNAESYNSSTSVPVRCQPVTQMCASLLRQEQDKLSAGRLEARTFLTAGRHLLPTAEDMLRDQLAAANNYSVRSRCAEQMHAHRSFKVVPYVSTAHTYVQHLLM